VVDGRRGDVRRYLPEFKPDPAWTFRSNRPVLHRSEGIAIDNKTGTLFLTSEWDGVIQAYNLETGQWLAKAIGCQTDTASGKPLGLSVFQRSVEGLAITGDYLLAVDEGTDDTAVNQPGHVLVFDLRSPALYKTSAEECRSRMAAGRAEGLVGWFGSYKSSDAVAIFPGAGNTPAMVAVADQGAYRVHVYFWKDMLEALAKAKPVNR
jgi:hypothetical protein